MQTTYLRSLISPFVVHCFDALTPLVVLLTMKNHIAKCQDKTLGGPANLDLVG